MLFCKVAGENGKKLLTEIFLSYQKRISSMDILKIFQLFANYFRVRAKVENEQHYKKLKQIRYFNIINIAEYRCTSEGSVINQSWSTQFRIATFSQMDNLLCLYDAWKGRSYINANVSVSLIFNNGQFYVKYYFLRDRNSPSKRFS